MMFILGTVVVVIAVLMSSTHRAKDVRPKRTIEDLRQRCTQLRAEDERAREYDKLLDEAIEREA